MKKENLIVNHWYQTNNKEIINVFGSNIIIFLGIDIKDRSAAPYCFLAKNNGCELDFFDFIKWGVPNIKYLLNFHEINFKIRNNERIEYSNNFISFLTEYDLKSLKPYLKEKLYNIINR